MRIHKNEYEINKDKQKNIEHIGSGNMKLYFNFANFFNAIAGLSACFYFEGPKF
jgi:hypothetical protein